jgi:murein DD-endopeptidase MepM/ murein hydrolase activator NlpD
VNRLKWVWALVASGLLLLTACSFTDEQITAGTNSNDEDLVISAAEEFRSTSHSIELTQINPTQTPIQLPVATLTPPAQPSPEPEIHATEILPVCPQPELFRSGRICYISTEGETFIHPISMVSDGQQAWLLDGGRVLQIDLENPNAPVVILSPGDMILGEPVQEPLDLALVDLGNEQGQGQGLLVLDRVGDVYLLDFETGEWVWDRYSRPIGQTSSHYYLSLSTNGSDRFLLEASYRYGVRYLPGQTGETGWSVDEEDVLVDLAVLRDATASFAYVLQRPVDTANAQIIRYVQGQIDNNFRPNIEITQPREIQVGPTAIYLLDQGGLRLSVLNNENGMVLSQTEFPFPISTFALYLDQFGSSLAIYAGRNTVYLPGQPDTQTIIDLNDVPTGGQSAVLLNSAAYDPQTWLQMPDLVLPIENLPPDARELRLPGAPRHYRQGIHEGMDFYWGPGREIRAIAAGTIIRADWDYVEPWPELFAHWRSRSAELGYTPDEALDFFRGRQIWIQHENGFISRHAHLSTIDFNIDVGVQIAQGQVIGQVGNSGSPGSLDGPTVDSHLHFELWYGDQGYLGQYLRPIETRELIKTIFTK